MTVFLVGAGPGDPGLLTVRGAEVLGRADVVVYDRLSIASLLDLAPLGAERISVGKAPGRPTMAQEDINALLVERGLRGQTVVRLKGGDPFVFARGGEEALALQAAGVSFEVVPGITSALAVPAYAGIPATMRHSSTSFTVVTGHEDPATAEQVDWHGVAHVGGTILILMGVARWPQISRRLIDAGLDPATPAAAVQWGTRPQQRTVRATVATLEHHELVSPSVIVVGDVAALDLAWFEAMPLFGRTVVVTRAREQASELVGRLRALGAEVIEAPMIRVAEPGDGGAALRGAVESLATYDWLVLTSPNGARRFLDELRASGRDARALAGVRIACIGPGTARVLADGHLVADLVPERFVAESLLDAMPAPDRPTEGRVLLARAAVARDVLPDGLRAKGWDVDVVDAYRTEAEVLDDAAVDAALAADAITFTSSSTVDRWVEAVARVRGEGSGAVAPPVVAAIGPVTADTARAHGLAVTVEAEEHTIDGLIEALVGRLGRRET